jgi:hypothetical protein
MFVAHVMIFNSKETNLNRRDFLVGNLALCASWRSAAGNQDTLDPVRLMPDTHKVVLENDFVRVIESRVPPGHMEVKHAHPHCVTVHLADVDAEIKTFPEGRITRTHRRSGTADWSEVTVHEVKNIGHTTSHNFRIELKERT